ncbi:MAG: CRISPR-associated endonuclease Cas1 [Pseudomonadota bacterium]
MGTLYIDRKHVRLDLDAEALVFFENGERIGTVPLGPLERIIVRGNVAVDTSLLGRLGARGIGLIVLDGRKREPSLFLPRRHKDAARRLAQYRAALDPAVCLAIARNIVRKKLAAQCDLLAAKLESRHDARYELNRAVTGISGMLKRLDDQPDLASLRGVEGFAANLYFTAFGALVPPSLGFKGRNRRPPRDPVNAVLSLAYTLLDAEAVLAAHAAGLDPALGFYHQPSYGRDSLASDLIEALRPDIERWVLGLFNKQVLRADDFSTSTQTGCLLGKAGRTRFYQEWETQAERLRRDLQEQCRDILRVIYPEAEAGEGQGFDDGELPEDVIRPA